MIVDPKIVDMFIASNPRVASNGFKALATFTLLIRPIRVIGCSLVVTPKGTYTIWTPSRELKIAKAAIPEIVTVALSEFKAANQRLA